jgi:hypothetical protein
MSRWALFLTVVLILLAAIHAYAWQRTSTTFRLGRRGRYGLAAVLATGLASLVLGRSLQGTIPDWASTQLTLAGFTILLAVLLAVGLLLPVDFVRWGAAGVRWIRRRLRGGGPDAPRPANEQAAGEPAHTEVSRRAFVGTALSASALVAGPTSALYAVLLGRHDYVIEEVPVPLPGLPGSLDGFSIVQLSDIHFGTFVDTGELRQAEDLVRRARPDLVVLTGDLVDHEPRHARYLGELVERLRPLARAGVAAVPGNHDYYTDIDVVLGTLRRAGAQVLRNEGRHVGEGGRPGFALLGIDDLWSTRYGRGPDLQRASSMVRPDRPRILLSHNPAFFPEAAPHVDVQLSGHTHGGQINPLSHKPIELLLPYGYVAGSYYRGSSRLYVNRGFGVAGPPARLGSPPEVTRIVLTRS